MSKRCHSASAHTSNRVFTIERQNFYTGTKHRVRAKLDKKEERRRVAKRTKSNPGTRWVLALRTNNVIDWGERDCKNKKEKQKRKRKKGTSLRYEHLIWRGQRLKDSEIQKLGSVY